MDCQCTLFRASAQFYACAKSSIAGPGEIPRGFPDNLVVKMATQEKKSVCLERLEQILPAAYSNYQLLVPALDLMIHYRIETIRQLNCVAKDLDERHRGGNIAKLVGSAAGIAGSTAAFAGAALTRTPFKGLGLVFIAAVASLGTATTVGALVTEKVLEKVDLEKVQQAVERDKAQCERVLQLWKEFDSYCTDAINTIALADPLKDSDVVSLQTWVQVALEDIVSPVILIAETFQEEYKNMTDGILTNPDCQKLCKNLGDMARKIIGDPVKVLQSAVSKLQKNLLTVAGTVAFIAILVIFVGNVLCFSRR